MHPSAHPSTPPLPAFEDLRVCTILPTYNERDNIATLIHGILHHATTAHVVIVVDDDSPDGTSQVVTELAQRLNSPDAPPVLWLERRTTEKGLTSAIRHGIDVAITRFGADIVTWMDCDLSMPPADVPRLVATLVDHNVDIAVGSRWAPGGADVAHGPMAVTLSRLINLYARLLIGGPVRDFTSGFIAARTPLFQEIRFHGDYGEYCIDFLGQAIRRGYSIAEMPYVCVPRHSGESKTGATLWEYLVKGRKYVAAGWRQARLHRRQS
ncbi:MAG: polyprenol monophosphomannose synthase [Litorilinea sp.]